MLSNFLRKFNLFSSALCAELHQLVYDSEQFHRRLIRLSSLVCFASCTCLSLALVLGYVLLHHHQHELSSCEVNASDIMNLYLYPRRQPRYASAYNAAQPRSEIISPASYMTNLKYGTSSRDSSLAKQNPFYSNPNQTDQGNDCKPCCIPGPPGPPGLNGQNGHPGDCGAAGEPGVPAPLGFMPCIGDDIVRELCAKCPSGPPGLSGSPGSEGDPGIPGEAGLSGTPGINGESGQPGPPGPPGEDGAPGDPGDLGEPAKKPADFYMEAGDPGPPGPPGPMGEMGPPGVSSDMFMPEPGPKGIRGPPGTAGKNGLPGQPGKPGLPGMLGEPGICPTYCAVDGGVFHDLSIVSSGNYIHDVQRRHLNRRRR